MFKEASNPELLSNMLLRYAFVETVKLVWIFSIWLFNNHASDLKVLTTIEFYAMHRK